MGLRSLSWRWSSTSRKRERNFAWHHRETSVENFVPFSVRRGLYAPTSFGQDFSVFGNINRDKELDSKVDISSAVDWIGFRIT
jgi:hypothetical protein